ncbi:hypothetical protein ACFC36_35470 [Streptomyces rubiginosohelvolus]|uniref:hypothetical protein n=1 Tax=Streptomyces rubiginosohelvolus TaxID=67362 RepID=UPI0035E1EFAB
MRMAQRCASLRFVGSRRLLILASPMMIRPLTMAHLDVRVAVPADDRLGHVLEGVCGFRERGDGEDRQVASVRQRGLAVSVGEAHPAYTCLAVPLPGRTDHALSVSLPSRTFGAARARSHPCSRWPRLRFRQRRNEPARNWLLTAVRRIVEP